MNTQPTPATVETPRTDGMTFIAQPGMMPPYNTVPADFARTLERELTATKAALAEAKKDKERLLQCLEDCVLGWGVGRPDHWADQDVDRWLADYTKAEQLCGEMRGLPDTARRAERGEGGVK